MEQESGVSGLTYRYTYGLGKNSVAVSGNALPNGAGSVAQYTYDDGTGEFVLTQENPGGSVVSNSIVKLWYHQGRLGSTDYLTNNVNGDVVSFVSYDDWGAPTMKAVLRLGQREFGLVTEYTGHPYDALLGVYYARARMYDAATSRMLSPDPIKGSITNTMTLVQYAYCFDNPLIWVDPAGAMPRAMLNAISTAYYMAIINKDQVGTVCILANVLDIATSTLKRLVKDALIVSILDSYKWIYSLYDMITMAPVEADIYEDTNANAQRIYLSFHEAAQVLAAKQIQDVSGAVLYPVLEARHGTRMEIDIKQGSNVWEVKPGYHNISSWTNSLNRYIKGYENGKNPSDYEFAWWENKNVPGYEFPEVEARIFEINGRQVSMLVQWLDFGRIGYFFKLKCGGGEDWVYAADIVADLLPTFNYSNEINEKSVQVVGAIAILVAALLTPIVGEIAAGGSVATTWASMAAVMSSIPVDVMSFLESAKTVLGY